LRIRLALALLVATAGATAVGTAGGAAPANARICGQIKNGPHASYWSVVTGIKEKDGTTWTVLATGVDCGFATNASKKLLPVWAHAKLGAKLPFRGYACVKMIDKSYSGTGTSSGGGSCHKGSAPATTIFDPGTFAFRMTGNYTIAQIKAFFGMR
jgi:hypothetical protein